MQKRYKLTDRGVDIISLIGCSLFAERIKTSKQTVYSWTSVRRCPTPKRREIIYNEIKKTNSDIKMEDLFEEFK